MEPISEILNFEETVWVLQIKELLHKINPNNKESWANRLDKELQSKLAWYLPQLGYYMRQMQQKAERELSFIREKHKTKSDADIEWHTTISYQNWKMAKTFRDDLTTLIHTLRNEVKEEYKQNG